VQVRGLDDVVAEVDDWLGAPGSWKLCTAANWPLTSEAIRRPTTSRCPLVVNIQNTEEVLLKTRLEETDKRHCTMVASLEGRIRDREQEANEMSLQFRRLKTDLEKLDSLSELNSRMSNRRQPGTCQSCWNLFIFFRHNWVLIFAAFALWMMMQLNKEVIEETGLMKRIHENEDDVHSLKDKLSEVQNSFASDLYSHMEKVKDTVRQLNSSVQDSLQKATHAVSADTAHRNILKQQVLQQMQAQNASMEAKWKDALEKEASQLEATDKNLAQDEADELRLTERKIQRGTERLIDLNRTVNHEMMHLQQEMQKDQAEARQETEQLDKQREAMKENRTEKALSMMQAQVDQVRRDMSTLDDRLAQLFKKENTAHAAISRVHQNISSLWTKMNASDVQASTALERANFNKEQLRDFRRKEDKFVAKTRSEFAKTRSELEVLNRSQNRRFDHAAAAHNSTMKQLELLNQSLAEDELDEVRQKEFESWKSRDEGEIKGVKHRLGKIWNNSRPDFLCVLCNSCGGDYPIPVGHGFNSTCSPGDTDCFGKQCADESSSAASAKALASFLPTAEVGPGASALAAIAGGRALVCCRRGRVQDSSADASSQLAVRRSAEVLYL